MRWTWTVCVVAAAAAAASSFAQDAAPAPARLVVKARITGGEATADDVAMMMMSRPGSPLDGLNLKTTFQANSGALTTIATATEFGGAGYFTVWFKRGAASSTAFVFVDDLKGELDLGELPMATSAPVLVSGRAVTADGKPAYGARIGVVCKPSRSQLFQFNELKATVDESGSFQIRGIVRGGSELALELGVDEGWATDQRIEFKAGRTDLKVVVQRTSGVRGTVAVPADLPLSDLVIQLVGPPGGVAAAEVEEPNLGFSRRKDVLEFPAAATYRVTGLRPGTYDVRLKFAGSSRWLARVAEVEIDETAKDLPLLEVKEAIRHAKALVTAAGGSAAEGVELWVRNGGDRGKFRPNAVGDDGSADVAYVGDDVTLAARAEGTDFVFATANGPDAKIALPPPASAPVTIELPAGSTRAIPGCELEVVLQWRGDVSAKAEMLDADFDANDPRAKVEVEVPIPESGPVVANATVSGWYEIALRKRVGRNSTSTSTKDRVRVVRGLPATAQCSVSPSDLGDVPGGPR